MRVRGRLGVEEIRVGEVVRPVEAESACHGTQARHILTAGRGHHPHDADARGEHPLGRGAKLELARKLLEHVAAMLPQKNASK